VVKNTLVQKALGGSHGESGDALFKGPVAIAYGKDPVSAAKVTADYAKGNDKFTVVGAIMGDVVLDQKGVASLATLPSLDQLRGTLIGLLNAPATRVAGVLQAPAGQLARVFNAYATKSDAA
jgi:large subunit ribosomal protein L10